MGKKATAQVVIEEEEDDVDFDNFHFEDDSEQDDDEAPETLNRAVFKKGTKPISKQAKTKKDKKKTKKPQTVIRGGDIFSEALPETEISELKAKQSQVMAKEAQERDI